MNILRNSKFVTAICVPMIGLMLHTVAFSAWADGVTSSAAEANQFGSQFLKDYQGPVSDGSNGAIFPGGGTVSVDSLFPGAGGGSNSDLNNVYGNDKDTLLIGRGAQTRLETEKGGNGDAYRTLVDSSNRASPNLIKDPIWNTTDEVLSNPNVFKGEFSDCKAESVFNNGTIKKHIPDYRTCERVTDTSGAHVLNHSYNAGVLVHDTGPANIQSCGVGCIYLWLGTVGDNYWSGYCSIFEESMKVKVVNPDAITKATLEYAKYDDYMQVWTGNTKIWNGPNGNFPPETGGECELGTSWEQSLNTDVTQYFKVDGLVEFKTRVSVAGAGEGYARIKILFDPNKAITQDEYFSEDAYKAATQVADGFCTTPALTCSDMPAVTNGCTFINGVQVCESHLKPSPFPTISPLCRKVTFTSECKFYQGDMDCYVDAHGVKRCPTNNGGNLDSCKKFEDDPKCGFIEQKCVGGAKGKSGSCSVFEEVWDCGVDVDVPNQQIDTTYSCSGPVRCAGGECYNPTYDKSNDFSKAVAALQIAQSAQHDMDCTGDDGIENDRSCALFKGEPMECKKAVGGWVNCCENPGGISLADYVNLTIKTYSLMEATGNFEMTKPVYGAWNQLKQPIIDGINSAWRATSDLWASMTDSGMAATDLVAKGAEQGVIATFKQALMNKTAEWTAQTFGAQAANAVFVTEAGGEFAKTGADGTVSTGGNAALGPVAQNIAMAANVIMIIYTIYVLTEILVNIIWECEEKEFELGAKKELKVCHFVGSYCASKTPLGCIEKRESYCCFNSPVARILQEQIRGQLGSTFGEAENPSCDPIPIAALDKVNWDKIDLGEWIGILQTTGNFPNASTVNLDNLTGQGSNLNVKGDRLDTLKRNEQRLQGIDADTLRHEAETQGWSEVK